MLSGALTAYAEYIADVITNECGRPVPARLLRYHGHAVPEDLGCDTGVLSVWWNQLRPQGSADCATPLETTLYARYVTCWKILDITREGKTILDDAKQDGDAAVLADVADCVSRALIRLDCAPAADDSETMRSLRAFALSGGKLPFLSGRPIGADGGIAGVEWSSSIRLRTVPAETS